MRIPFHHVALSLFCGVAALPELGPQALARWPDNPCAVLTAAQMADATGLDVVSMRRVPRIGKVVRADEPNSGTICVYETRSDFGALSIVVPERLERAGVRYWQQKAEYFATYRGSAQNIAMLGRDAWLAGGAALTVLVSDDEYVGFSTQMYQPDSRELLIKIARAALQLPR